MGILMFGEVVWDDITPRGGSGKPEHLGGAPLNVAANCVKLGIQSGVCSALGRDTWGDAALQGVEMLEVDSRLIVRNERDTCLIQVRFDKQGEPYRESQLVRKSPRKYTEFHLEPDLPIYTQFEKDPQRFRFVVHPEEYEDLWRLFVP